KIREEDEITKKKNQFDDKQSKFIVLPQKAFLQFKPINDVDTNGELVIYILELQVVKEHQRKGIGTKFIQLIEEIAKSAKIEKLQLTALSKKRCVLSFYKANQFDFDKEMDPVLKFKKESSFRILSKDIN
ncbi:N-alpha-acetyltransferase 40, partial [Bonamia ostreae]